MRLPDGPKQGYCAHQLVAFTNATRLSQARFPVLALARLLQDAIRTVLYCNVINRFVSSLSVRRSISKEDICLIRLSNHAFTLRQCTRTKDHCTCSFTQYRLSGISAVRVKTQPFWYKHRHLIVRDWCAPELAYELCHSS